MARVNELVATRVRDILAGEGISQHDFFVATGMAERTGARRLAGASSWSTDELAAAAKFLGVPISELVDADDEAVAS